jgi:hypothetical protein
MQLVIGAVGAAIGFAVGGPVGAQIGWALGTVIGAAVTPGPKTSGPRLTDLKITGTEYGQAIPFVQGHPRGAGQVLWCSDRHEISNTTSQGGKGGGAEQTTYTYTVDIFYELTDNEITAVTRIWDNGLLIWTNLSDADSASLDASANTNSWTRMTVYTGSPTQMPDPTYEAAIQLQYGSGVTVPAYRGRGCVFIEGLNLGNSGQLRNLTFEVTTKGTEVAAGDVILLLHGDGSTVVDSSTGARTPTGGATDGAGHLTFSDLATAPQLSFVNGSTYSPGRGEYCYEFFITWPGATGQQIIFTDRTTGGQGVFLVLLASGIMQYVYSTGNDPLGGGGGNPLAGTSFGLAVGARTHIAITRETVDGGGPGPYTDITRFFIGGVLAAILTKHPASQFELVDTGAGALWWGSDNPAIQTGQTLGALIDNVRWTNGIARYTANFTPPATPLLDDQAGSFTLADETLEDVVTRLCQRAGMPAGTFDTSALAAITKPVRALAVSQLGATRATLEMLASAYFFESYLADKLYFVPRGGAPVLTIPWTDLGASADETGAAEPLALKPGDDLEIPARVSVTYENIDDDYQSDTQTGDRLVSTTNTVTSIELALGFTAQEAKGIADAMVMDQVASQVATQIALLMDYAQLTPTDVVGVAAEDGTVYRIRLVKRSDAAGVLAFDCVFDDASVLTSAGITSTDYTPSTEVVAPAATVIQLMDIPILQDADNAMGIYVAAQGTTKAWAGGAIYSSPDNSAFTLAATVTDVAVFGTCTTTLPDWTLGKVFDETNTVTVDVGAGQLSSAARDDVLDSAANGCLIGSEILQFRTVTLVSAGVYTLSGLVRGQRGTEAATVGHAAGERFVLLQPTGLRRVVDDLATLDVARYWKGVTIGSPLSTGTSQTFTDTGVALRPFSPVGLRGDRALNADLTLTWDRRTRLSGEFLNGVDVPLGENSEAYEIDICTDGTFSTVKRTLTSSTPSVIYTGAMQATDFGSPQVTVSVVVYQMSASVGRGAPLRGTLVRPLLVDGFSEYGLRPIMEFGGYVVAGGSINIYASTDGGATYSVAIANAAVPAAYGYGVSFFDAALGTQRISIGVNVFAFLRGQIVAGTNPTALPTQTGGDPVTPTFAPLDSSGHALDVGALYSDGTHYFIVGHYADGSQATGGMFLFKADATLSWVLQGQLAQDPADPHMIAPGQYGAFVSQWFVPQAGLSAGTSRLTKVGSRWFLIGTESAYYTDDAAGLTGWLRCPLGFLEGTFTPAAKISDLRPVGSTLLAVGPGSTGLMAKSTDNGATWTALTPFAPFQGALAIRASGGNALIYCAVSSGYATSVGVAAAPFTSWTFSPITGIYPGLALNAGYVLPTSTGFAASDTEFGIVYSTDGIAWSYPPLI